MAQCDRSRGRGWRWRGRRGTRRGARARRWGPGGPGGGRGGAGGAGGAIGASTDGSGVSPGTTALTTTSGSRQLQPYGQQAGQYGNNQFGAGG